MEATARESHAPIPYRTFVNVWVALVILTGITVGAHYTNLKHMAVFVAVLIAAVKSTLVLMYFMHLRFERKLFTFMLVAILLTYAVFVILTFADYSFRVE